eukprot:9378947-Alexandrium_andersonii.AAC.1
MHAAFAMQRRMNWAPVCQCSGIARLADWRIADVVSASARPRDFGPPQSSLPPASSVCTRA